MGSKVKADIGNVWLVVSSTYGAICTADELTNVQSVKNEKKN